MLYLYIYIDNPLNNLKNSRTVLAISIASMLLFSGTNAFAVDSGTLPDEVSNGIIGISSLDPVGGAAPTFFGNGGYSADGCGTNSGLCTLEAEVPAGSTVEKAFLYLVAVGDLGPSTTVELDAIPIILDKLTQNNHAFLTSYRADVTAQVAAKVGGGGGITTFDADELSNTSAKDGTALVVIFSNPVEPQTSVIVLDGGLTSTGAETLVGLAEPLDKTVPGFSAIMSLGISFSAQDQSGLATNLCGVDTGQDSKVDINGVRLSSCAGNLDDGVGGVSNGILITVGGVGDNTANPLDPLQEAADGGVPRVDEDELYDLEPFLSQGDTVIDIDTVNDSGDDNIFLSVIAITAKASLENCFNGIDDDGDGLVDQADPDCQVEEPPVVGGELLSIDSTALVLAGIQTSSVWILSVLAGIGSVAFATLYIKTKRD